jgi:hypothetical protein
LQDLLARDLASLIHPLHDRRDQSGASYWKLQW